jgi:hypothetical protein
MNNYNNDTSWIKEYTENYIIYNKGEKINDQKAIQVPNVGYNIFDYLLYIIDNYDDLPPSVMFIKSNIFPRHMTKEEFDAVCERTEFTPLLSKEHKTYMPVCYYDENEVFNEKNNSWYVYEYPAKFFQTYHEFAEEMGLQSPSYIPFAPGANYIVPRENILKHPKEFYAKLKGYVDYTQLPGEAHIIERALYSIWK